MKYRNKGVTKAKGFGATQQKDEERLREQSMFYVLGYGKWLEWSDIEPDTLVFTQNHWDEANELFGLLAQGKTVEALTALRKGPWTASAVAQLLPELDVWARLVSPERDAQGPMNGDLLTSIGRHGLETYHRALLEKHKESAEATEALQNALEELGLELWDTGAYYDKEGNMEGGRDLVMGVPNSKTEYTFRVFHSPRVAETDDDLPDDVSEVVRQWEAAK
jgi:hypothetical protein